MRLDDRKRTLLRLRKLRAQGRAKVNPRKVLPRQQQPDTIRREYFKSIRYVCDMAAAVFEPAGKQIVQLLAELRTEQHLASLSHTDARPKAEPEPDDRERKSGLQPDGSFILDDDTPNLYGPRNDEWDEEAHPRGAGGRFGSGGGGEAKKAAPAPATSKPKRERGPGGHYLPAPGSKPKPPKQPSQSKQASSLNKEQQRKLENHLAAAREGKGSRYAPTAAESMIIMPPSEINREVGARLSPNEVESVIRAHQEGIRDRGTEIAAVMDSQGNVLVEVSQLSRNDVRFTHAQLGSMEDSTLIHNHPSSSPMSPNDLYLVAYTNGASIRAIARDGVEYRMDKPPGGWPDVSGTTVRNNSVIVNAGKQALELVSPRYQSGELSSHAATQLHYHMLSSFFAKETGATYTRVMPKSVLPEGNKSADKHTIFSRNHPHMDAVSGKQKQAMALVDSTARKVANSLRPKELYAVALKFGKRTSAFQKQQLDKQVQAAIGVPLSAIEKPITEKLEGFAALNVDLIVTVPERYFDRLRTDVTTAFESGMRPETLARKMMEDDYEISLNDARRIANDQIGKLTAQLNEERQVEMGVSGYIWRTMNDARVRDDHVELEGKSFAWDDEDGGDEDGNPPGEAINCRCYAEPDFQSIFNELQEGTGLSGESQYANQGAGPDDEGDEE